MNTLDRIYRFCEFGREIVYDTEGATAFFLDNVEADLLDHLQNQKTLEESIALLNGVYTREEIAEAVDHVESEGLLSDQDIPYQPLSKIYALTLNVTQRCNLACKYCYVEDPGSQPFMSESTARRAVDFIADYEGIEGFGIAFYGGEPLLNFPVIQSTIEYASREAEKRGLPEVKYDITTNGTLVTDEMIDFFREYKVAVMFSMDGPAHIHDALRVTPQGEGTHALVLENLQKLINATGEHKVSVSSVITNRSRLKDAYEYLSQFPLTEIKLSYVRYLNEIEERKYALSESQRNQFIEDMRGLAKECLNLLLEGTHPPYYNFENKILHLWTHTKRKYFCPAGLTRFGISPEGGIYPCGPASDLRDWKLGTLKEGLEEKAVNRWVSLISVENRDKCISCWARYLCVGGCPVQAVRGTDKKRCEINILSSELAIAIYAAVKEKNEMLLASLVDGEFLAFIRKMLQEYRI